MTAVDLQALAEETLWLADNPDFRERPATLVEFLGPDYLNIREGMRDRVVEVLAEIMGHEVSAQRPTAYSKAMFTGGIGIGKTTVASIVLSYLVHWVLCLNDPQKYFGLLPGSRIAFMMMSTKASQVREVVFGDLKARIRSSRWFKDHPFDPSFKNEIRFGGELHPVWIVPGDSTETAFEGYNILGGVIDEADSHKLTENKDYAQEGYDVILNRIKSRFQSRGFIMVIGQMKSSSGFAAKIFEELKADPEAYVARLTIWESFGWEHYRDPATGELETFWYDTKRKEILSDDVVKLIGEQENMTRVPMVYKEEFVNNPEKALKDLAGIPPRVNSPFISLTDRIPQGRTLWVERFGEAGPVRTDGRLEPWFVAPNTLPRVVHIDIGYSPNGDAAAVVMGHIPEMVEISGELKPFIVIDMLYRFTAVAGKEIEIGDIRQLIYNLKDVRKFRIVGVTMDGFQCFTGDTRIPLLDGRTLSMAELAEAYPNGGPHTYSHDGDRIVPGRIVRAWKSGTKRVIRVTLDNGETVRCTPDHRWMLRDGTYREVADLKHGDQLMPLERRVTGPDWKGIKGYEQVLQPGPRRQGRRYRGQWCRGRWQYTHVMVLGPNGKGEVVHHADFNKLNNDPGNLLRMLIDEYLHLHRQSGADFGLLWRDPEFREKTSRAVSESNRQKVGRFSRHYKQEVSLEELKAYAHLGRREVTAQTGWSQDMIYARVREAGYSGWADFRQSVGVNHRVARVEDLGEIEDVFDLEMEGSPNFALEAGVFVHNSKDTEQQLNKRRIPAEYLSVDREVLPYHDLKEAIYENRIAFPPYVVPRRPDKQELVEILLVELEQLMDTGKKIDHPQGGSKDVSDAVAGVVSNLMGNVSLHRGRNQSNYGFREAPVRSPFTAHRLSIPMTPSHPAYRGSGVGMPIPDFRGF